MEKVEKCGCVECAQREEEHKLNEEMNLAVLIALVPMLTLTVFSNMGLF